MSRYTKDRWARTFKQHKFQEIGDMKLSEMMRQMKALLPTDSTPGMYFMAAFLLRLPADMIDHAVQSPSTRTTKQTSTPSPRPGDLAPRQAPPLAVPPRAQPPEDPGPVQGRQRLLLLSHYIRRPGEEVQARVPVVPGNGAAAEN